MVVEPVGGLYRKVVIGWGPRPSALVGDAELL